MSTVEICLTIAAIAAGTMLSRGLPFVLFSRVKTPPYVGYLGRTLPPAAIGLLIVYCFKDVSFTEKPYGAPEITASIAAALIQVLFRRTLLSIVMSTALYMLLIRI